MERLQNEKLYWSICQECQGQGKKQQRLRKKVRLQYKNACEAFKNSNSQEGPPQKPKKHLYKCAHCEGSGLALSKNAPVPDNHLPHIAIVGAGIGGVALAVACLHRGIPFRLFERDESFDARAQGYGLTLQQANKAIKGLGIFPLQHGVVSKRHLVHTVDGDVIGEWGAKKWITSKDKLAGKKTNIHIARQLLRLALLDELDQRTVNWGHELVDFSEGKNHALDLVFKVKDEIKSFKADLVVGADGIRSNVRKISLNDNVAPLHYLECIVILGICPLNLLDQVESSLLDGETVFQTANGEERIYVMPYTADAIMWQLSFPMTEAAAKILSNQGAKALKMEACRRISWHSPIPEILKATPDGQISGYPVYDRELLTSKMLETAGASTLIGDAAHPMSPFKGQGANQAILDALALARSIYKECRFPSIWKLDGLRKHVLTSFETEMLERSAVKVKDSAAAAQFLHSEVVLHKSDAPRGRHLKP